MKPREIAKALETFSIPGRNPIQVRVLQRLLPDTETALFFGKLYKLSYHDLSHLIYLVFNARDIVKVLMDGEHSEELQDYIVDTVPDHVLPGGHGGIVYTSSPSQGELLPDLWESVQMDVAKSIQTVADKLGSVLESLPSKEGAMVFKTMALLNKQRPTIGRFQTSIQHQSQPDVLVILDVSGSMTEPTIRSLIGDVIALSYSANAHLAIVSQNTYYWEPATFTEEDVLSNAEYLGTHYETLIPLFKNRDWGTVITIADYDSARSAQQEFARLDSRVGQVLDISLVNKSTYLAECIGTLADEVTPLLIGNSRYPL